MGTVYLDVSDVIEYFTYNMTASGIQRVQLEFIRVFAKGDSTFCFVIESGKWDGFIVVDTHLLETLVDHVDRGDFTRDRLDDLLREVRASSKVALAGPDDLFFVSGAFWASSSTLRSLWSAKEAGARVGFLCYDLIPIRNREFCDEGLALLFTQAFESICSIVDFIFTISRYVQRDVEAYLTEIGASVPVVALPLAHELAAPQGPRIVSERVKALMERPFVLFVSTIEARKNHAYALTVWQRLLERIPEQVPDMIWVGRPGWLVDDLLKRVRRLDHLGGRLKIVNNLSDAELSALYRGSLFSLYPSLAEGWGLPVAESLMFAKTAVVSRTTSLPEVGGDFVFYIDPDNITEGVETVERLLLNPELREQAELRIRSSFRPRLWRDVCDDLARGFEALRTSVAPRPDLPKVDVKPGLVYPAGGNQVQGGAELTVQQRSALDASFDPNWYAAEAWGRWVKGVAGTVRLRIGDVADRSEPTEYVLAMRVQIFGGWNGKRVSLHCAAAGLEATYRVKPDRHYTLVARMPLPPGEAAITLRADRDDVSGGPDPRRFAVGLVAFGFVAAADHQKAQSLLNAFPSHEIIESAARPVGPVSALKPAKLILPANDWRFKLFRRSWWESPRLLLARILRRIASWLSRDELA